MNKFVKIAVVAALLVVVGVVVAVKKNRSLSPSGANTASTSPAGIPRLVDLGSTTCVPCKLMAPILEELKKECAGVLAVEFIDVNVDTAASNRYGVKLIPTQIFFDASGKELFRHEGFFSKEDILAKWKELGVTLAAASSSTIPSTTPAVKSGST